MKELITIQQANAIVLTLSCLLPLAGLITGYVLKRPIKGLCTGTASGSLLYALWYVYNRLTDHFGLDSVKNLEINLAFFILVGLGAGIAAAYTFNSPTKR